MKKIVMLLCALLIVTLASAEEHVCQPSGLVDMDLSERWELCECGERLNVTQHVWVTDEWGDQLCSVCGAQQYLWDDGTLELCGVDEYGSVVRQISWDADGAVTMDLSTVYQYDAEGHLMSAWYYEGEVLYAESEFALDAEGYEWENRAIVYYDDGSMSVTEYNEQGDEILVAFYLDGVLEAELRYEYTYDEQGRVTRMRTFSDGAVIEEVDYVIVTEADGYFSYPARMTAWYEDDTRVTYILDANGDTLSETYYDAAANILKSLSYENEYDDAGNLVRVTTTEDGVLSRVEEYAVDADGWIYRAKEIVYNADGTSTEIRYDENGEVIE